MDTGSIRFKWQIDHVVQWKVQTMIVQVCGEYVQVYKCLLFCEREGASICMSVCKDIVEDMHHPSS